MIYADEAAMMKACFGDRWPSELNNVHEISEQIYAEWTWLSGKAEK